MRRYRRLGFSPMVLSIGALLIGFLAPLARAVTINESETLADFGTLSQYNSGVTVMNALNVQEQACVPTSFANALTYLNNVNGGTVFAHDPNSYADVNSLATAMGTANNPFPPGPVGTSYAGGANGFEQYNSAGGANPSTGVTISGQYAQAAWGGGLPYAGANFANVIPTDVFLGGNLANDNAVELGIQWGSYNQDGTVFTPAGGFHAIVLYSLNLVDGAGFASVIDPISANGQLNDNAASAQVFTASMSTVGGYMYLTYPLQIADDQTDGTDNGFAGFGALTGETARIVAVWAEAVPEPSTYIMAVMGLGAVLIVGCRRKPRATAD
jgi:hypothetical protein